MDHKAAGYLKVTGGRVDGCWAGQGGSDNSAFNEMIRAIKIIAWKNVETVFIISISLLLWLVLTDKDSTTVSLGVSFISTTVSKKKTELWTVFKISSCYLWLAYHRAWRPSLLHSCLV